MLHLKTAAGERLELPASCIIAVMKPCDGENPSAIIYDIGVSGAQFQQLTDQYGFVKKLAIDGMAMVNPLEVRVLEPVPGVDGLQEGKLFFTRSRIVGRREVLGGEDATKSILFVDLLGKPAPVKVANTLDELDGNEAAPVAVEPASTEEGN